MHFVTDVSYMSGYKLLLTFRNGARKVVDLEPYLDGEVFEPLRNVEYFRSVSVNPDIDTIAWDNGADFAPESLYEAGASESSSAA
jgi:hypothetical protein